MLFTGSIRDKSNFKHHLERVCESTLHDCRTRIFEEVLVLQNSHNNLANVFNPEELVAYASSISSPLGEIKKISDQSGMMWFRVPGYKQNAFCIIIQEMKHFRLLVFCEDPDSSLLSSLVSVNEKDLMIQAEHIVLLARKTVVTSFTKLASHLLLDFLWSSFTGSPSIGKERSNYFSPSIENLKILISMAKRKDMKSIDSRLNNLFFEEKSYDSCPCLDWLAIMDEIKVYFAFRAQYELFERKSQVFLFNAEKSNTLILFEVTFQGNIIEALFLNRTDFNNIKPLTEKLINVILQWIWKNI